jgi:hypothetical protein
MSQLQAPNPNPTHHNPLDPTQTWLFDRSTNTNFQRSWQRDRPKIEEIVHIRPELARVLWMNLLELYEDPTDVALLLCENLLNRLEELGSITYQREGRMVILHRMNPSIETGKPREPSRTCDSYVFERRDLTRY